MKPRRNLETFGLNLWSITGLLLAIFLAPPAIRGGPLQRQVYSEPHMGTMVEITLFAGDQETGAGAGRAAFSRIQELNSILSDYDAESELMKLTGHGPGQPVPVSDDLFAVLSRAREISVRTGGAFDVTAAPLVRLWRESRRNGTLPSPDAIDEARRLTGFENLQLDPAERTVTLLIPGVQIDLGGIAKGYAAEEALKVLRDRGVPRALVAVAGDIAAGDAPPGTGGWRVGIASINAGPFSPAAALRPPGADDLTTTVRLENAAVSTSGDTEQFVEIDGARYSHIVDPKTGIGLTDRISVTVLAKDAMTADALSTAISVMGKEDGLSLAESLANVEVSIVRKNDSETEIAASSGFPAE